jgi:hypothetical protein
MFPTKIAAPVNAGQTVGKARILYQGSEWGKVDLIATTTIEGIIICQDVRLFLGDGCGGSASGFTSAQAAFGEPAGQTKTAGGDRQQ